jgi:hypothetical protein
MARSRGAKFMLDNINRVIVTFLNMSSEDRIKFINRYSLLLPYERTALLQCKKFMNTAERKALKTVQEKLKTNNNENEPPQPM